MRLSVGQIVRLTGTTHRTLRYYDQIGLLKPTQTTEAGYRFYDGEAVARLQQILFYRELDFSLAEISDILSAANFDRERAMAEHRTLLTMKRDRLNALIRLTEESMEEKDNMGIDKFNDQQIQKTKAAYAAEAKQRWGQTDAFKESQQKTAGYGDKDWAAIQAEADEIFAAFAAQRGSDPAAEAVQALVKRWQQHITDRYYTCTNAILGGLGEMYVCDERFQENLDRFGSGTAQLMHDAIAVYVADKHEC